MSRFRRCLWLVLPALLAYTAAHAQLRSADSIRKELAALDPKAPGYLADKIGCVGTLLQVVKFTDKEEALRLSDTLAALHFLNNDSAKAYEAKYRVKATIYEQGARPDKMLENLEAYAEALSRIGKSDGYAYIDIGNVYFSFGLYDLANESYRFGEAIFEKKGDIHGTCVIYNNYAQIQMGKNNPDSALAWLRKSYELRKNKLNDRILADESHFIMSYVFRETRQFDSARVLLRKVIADLSDPALEQHTDHLALRREFSGAFSHMAGTYAQERQWDSALVYFRKGEAFYTKHNYGERMFGLYSAWARMYMQQKNPDSALVYIRKAEARADRFNPTMTMPLYQLYADYYELTGNMEASYRNRMLYYRMADSMQATGHNERLMVAGSRVLQLQDKARIEQQKLEIAEKNLEAQENERRQFSLYMIAGALFVIVVLAVFSVYQLRKKNKIIVDTNRELEAANATKAQFLSIISHDLRQPFNTLIGMSNLLVNNVREKNYVQVSDNAELINESSRKAYVLLDNLMQWVSLQKENIRVQKATVEMNELVEEVMQLFRGQALAQSITVAKEIRLARAYTDKNLLQVILRNLLSNAIRHIPVGGRVQLTIDQSGGDVRIVVEDNGKGFTEGQLKELFRQKDATNIARRGGGLGLLLVEQFVRQLGGTITAANVETGGAKFTLLLHDALAAEGVMPGQTQEQEKAPALTPEDKRALFPLVNALKQYEVFDTTELRAALEQHNGRQSPAIVSWRKQVLQAVYHTDEVKFKTLIESASLHEDL